MRLLASALRFSRLSRLSRLLRIRSCVVLTLACGLLAPAFVQAAEPPRDAPAPTAAEPANRAGAAYHFSVAKMLMDEGDYRGARGAFEQALELDPSAAYVRIEYAEFLSRLGRFGRTAEERKTRLDEAAEQAALADAALPGNADALRAIAAANLALAAEIPDRAEAMAKAVEALEGVRAVEPHDVRSMLSLGQIYLRRGQAAEAADVFESVVDTTPGYLPAYRFLAEALLEAGRRADAAGALRKVVEGEPENEAARLALAEILAEQGKHQEAIDILQAHPAPLESVEARSRLATELYLVGDLDQAGDLLGQLAGDAPDSRFIRLLHGLVLSAQARNEEALATLEPLLDGGPGDADLAVTVSELLLREEREDEAVDMLRDTVNRLEEDGSGAVAAEVRLALGRLYANLGRWQEVEETTAPLVDGAGDGGTDSVPALLLWADALAEQGRGEPALDRLRKTAAGRGDETEPALLSKQVELLGLLGRTQEAVDILSALADPREEGEGGEEGEDAREDAFLRATEGLHRSEHYAETIVPLERFVAGRPDSVIGRFLLGAARERSGRREEAVAAFRALLQEEPDFHPALNYLGYMWIEEGENLDEAIEMVGRAVELDPDNGAYVDSLGWGLFQLGRYEEARGTLERAARLAQDPTIYEHLGDVYAALGDADGARRAYQRAMALEADDPDEVARKLSDLDSETGAEPPDVERH